MGHLWKRSSGYVFQIHIPQGFVDRFGATPIRVRLGRLPASEARRRARILAGRATAMMEIGMRREVVARSLEALAAEMDRLKRAAFSAEMRALPQGPSKQDREDPEWYEAREPEEIAYEEASMRAAAARRDTLRETQQRLEGLGQVLAQDGAAWSAERETYDHLLSRMSAIPVTTPAPTPPSPAPGPVAASQPLLSATIPQYLAQKLESDVSERHVDGLSRRFRAFMEHVGDKPLNEYRASDLQSFVSTLARVPANWAKEAAIKDASARAAAEWNAAQRRPLPIMAEGTINLGYARPMVRLARLGA